MNCGTPIKSGFFCAKCQAGETPSSSAGSSGDSWKGSRFSGDAKKRRQQEMMKQDLAIWGKRLVILLVLAGIGFGGYVMFGDRIMAAVHQGESVAKPREKYDPTKDAAANEDDQGQQNGQRPLSNLNGKL